MNKCTIKNLKKYNPIRPSLSDILSIRQKFPTTLGSTAVHGKILLVTNIAKNFKGC